MKVMMVVAMIVVVVVVVVDDDDHGCGGRCLPVRLVPCHAMIVVGV